MSADTATRGSRNEHLTCPVCEGRGQLKAPLAYGKRTPDKRVMAKLLRREGYSIREIMRFLDYRSPQSVQLLLK